MLNYAITFFVIAIIAALLGFSGIAGSAASIAKILFLVFLVLAIITYTRGTSAQLRWDRVSRPPNVPPPVAQP
jgi:uncharacterized membrane protein YtjA (UPF0391 family)